MIYSIEVDIQNEEKGLVMFSSNFWNFIEKLPETKSGVKMLLLTIHPIDAQDDTAERRKRIIDSTTKIFYGGEL